MNERMKPDPIQESSFGEGALLTLFEEIEPPAGLNARWRARIALPPADEIRTDGAEPAPPAARRLRGKHGRRAAGPWAQVAAIGVSVTTIAAIAVGVVAANRRGPSPDPAPDPSPTITNPPSPTSMTPPSAPYPPPSGSVPNGQPGQRPVDGPTGRGKPNGLPSAPNPAVPAVPPARGPLTEWPDEANTGVTPGTALRPHSGDLHVDTAGAVVHDLRVEGTVYVAAPNVTLRRVQVVAPGGAAAGVRQRAQATGLRIEDSEISGMGGNVQVAIRQEAPGLWVQRTNVVRADTSVAVTSDATLVDNRLGTVQTTGNTARLVMRHNTIDSIAMADENGPVTEVSIENNRLGLGVGVTIWAPARPGSHHIRVTGNHFNRGNPVPCNGWNDQAPGNTWTGNVWFGTNEPVNPS